MSLFPSWRRNSGGQRLLDELWRQRSHRLAATGTITRLSALDLMRRAGLEPEPWQCRVVETPGNQLILVHRQRGKTTLVAAEALAVAANKPQALALIVAPSQKQSQEALRKVKGFYRETGLPALVRDSETSIELPNGSRVLALPGNPDTIVGYSAIDLLILDEAARIPDVVAYALRPMLLMSHGRLLAPTTPYGQRGWFYEAWTQHDGQTQHALDKQLVADTLKDLGWTLDEVPDEPDRPYGWTATQVTVADKSPRVSPYFLASERRSIPDLVFRQEYLCEFVEQMGAVFRYEDLQAALSPNLLPLFADGSPERALLTQLLPHQEPPLWSDRAC